MENAFRERRGEKSIVAIGDDAREDALFPRGVEALPRFGGIPREIDAPVAHGDDEELGAAEDGGGLGGGQAVLEQPPPVAGDRGTFVDAVMRGEKESSVVESSKCANRDYWRGRKRVEIVERPGFSGVVRIEEVFIGDGPELVGVFGDDQRMKSFFCCVRCGTIERMFVEFAGPDAVCCGDVDVGSKTLDV